MPVLEQKFKDKTTFIFTNEKMLHNEYDSYTAPSIMIEADSYDDAIRILQGMSGDRVFNAIRDLYL